MRCRTGIWLKAAFPAGICDPTGRIFGLMPHPEAYNHWTNHPDWTRIKEAAKRQDLILDSAPTVGIQMLQNAVDYIRFYI